MWPYIVLHANWQEKGFTSASFHRGLCFLSCSEKHYLHFKFIALTKADLFPEFSAKAVCDDMQIAHYSNDKQAWVRDNLTVDEGNRAPAGPPETREWFLDNLYDLSKCTHHAECSGEFSTYLHLINKWAQERKQRFNFIINSLPRERQYNYMH